HAGRPVDRVHRPAHLAQLPGAIHDQRIADAHRPAGRLLSSVGRPIGPRESTAASKSPSPPKAFMDVDAAARAGSWVAEPQLAPLISCLGTGILYSPADAVSF